jgi:hypothetical protein
MNKYYLYLGELVANYLTTKKAGIGALVKSAAIAAAFCASSVATAGVLNFETPVDAPFVFDGDFIELGEYYIAGAGNGFVGTIGGSDQCDAGVQCPANNPTNYYSALADGYFIFGKNDLSEFKIKSLDASFIGNNQGPYPAVSALLYVAGYDANGFVAETYLELAGPIGGSFNFANYDMGAFSNFAFTDVLVASYACNAAGDCDRTSNKASFAIDNIVTFVPEPGSFALLGLGLLGLGAASRRRAA